MIGSVQSTAYGLSPLEGSPSQARAGWEERPNEISVQAWLGLTAEGARKAPPPPRIWDGAAGDASRSSRAEPDCGRAPVRRWDHAFANDFWRWQRPQRPFTEDLELAPPPRAIDPGLATYTLTPGRLTPRGAPMLALASFAPADPRKGVTVSVLV